MTCIFCVQTRESKRDAHVLPEGVVVNDLTLPRGTECDDCNEYFADIENAFIHHNRIWTAIMLGRVPGKGGRLRRELGHFSVDRDEEIVTIRLRIPESAIRQGDAGVEIEMPDAPEYDELKFRRTLHCIALRYLAWKRGADLARSEVFDPVRKYVRFARRGESWPYVQVPFADDVIRRELRLELVDGAPGTTVRLQLFHDDFYCDLQNSGQLHDWAATSLGTEAGLL